MAEDESKSLLKRAEPTYTGEKRSLTCEQALEEIGFGKFQIKLLFVSGFVWMADAFEMMLLSFLSPALACDWGLTGSEEALLTTTVFVGMLIGSSAFGLVSDHFGRKVCFVITTLEITFFGLLSALAPSFGWLLAARFLVGVGVGGVHVVFTLFAEFLPATRRATCLITIALFWAIGSVLAALLAWAVMPVLGWRYLLGFSAVPCGLLLLLSPLVSESARFHVVKGEPEKAYEVLLYVAQSNDVPMPCEEITVSSDKPASPLAVLSPGFRKTSLLLWLIWFCNAFCYYGMVLLVTEIFHEEKIGVRCSAGGLIDTGVDTGPSAPPCVKLGAKDYVGVLLTSAAEIPGLLVTGALIDMIGRKRILAVELGVSALCFLALMLCTGRALETIELFSGRGLMVGAFQVVFIYTPEIYPTSLRSTGMGVCNSMARVGGMLTPYVAEVLMRHSVVGALVLYAGVCVFGAIAALLLPMETNGRRLADSLEQAEADIAEAEAEIEDQNATRTENIDVM